jgi:rod shape-determining protein MreD
MFRKDQLKYVAPIIFFFLMLIDAHLTKTIETWTDNTYFASAHFLLLAFLFVVPQMSRRYLITVSLIIGFICDCYYTGIIGFYSVALTATVVLMFIFKDVIQTNLLTGFFGMVIFVTLYEMIAMLLQVIFHISNIHPLVFVTEVLGPTLLLNMLIFVLFSYLFKKLLTAKD